MTDGRKVISDLRYDMGGTRIYKRDWVRQTTDASDQDPKDLLSDRETYYLANGTEVLMEVEQKGAQGVNAPDRYTAYIFGAGARMARISWDSDSWVAVPLQNVNFSTNQLLNDPTHGGWALGKPTSTDPDKPDARTFATIIQSAEDPSRMNLRISRPSYGHVDQTLGVLKPSEVVSVSFEGRADPSLPSGLRGILNVRLVDRNLTDGDGNKLVYGEGALYSPEKWVKYENTFTLPATIPAAGTEVVLELNSVLMTQVGVFPWVEFDNVKVRKRAGLPSAQAKANVFSDPGFESVLKPDSGTTITDLAGNEAGSGISANLEMDGTCREGVHVLNLGSNTAYHRKVTGLVKNSTYLLSIWKKVGDGAWTRHYIGPNQADATVLSGDLLWSTQDKDYLWVHLYGPGKFDQAEMIPYTMGESLPESWIPENRLGRTEWFITDHLGSTKLIVAHDGTHRFTGDDDPFGLNLRSFGDRDPHRFTGQVLDDEQGVYYCGARYYLPEIGRFISTDPMRQTHSLYNYCGNNPILNVDPDGNTFWDWLFNDSPLVQNPIYQAAAQVSDTLMLASANLLGTPELPCLSNMGKAAQRGCSNSELVQHALKGPEEVMIGAIIGKGLDVWRNYAIRNVTNTTISNGTVYEYDSNMRPIKVSSSEVKIGVDAPRNSTLQTRIGKMWGENGQGSHLMPNIFKGLQKSINMIPGGPRMNLSLMKSCENFAKGLVEQGYNVQYSVTCNYPGSNTMVPDFITIEVGVMKSGSKAVQYMKWVFSNHE